jgi:MYXO-CTERM domain-containing protein
LDFVFDVTIAAGNSWANAWDAYAPDGPHLKIDWVGSQNNYDLVSAAVGVTTSTPVPAPGNTLGLLGLGLIGIVGAVGWRRRRQQLPIGV